MSAADPLVARIEAAVHWGEQDALGHLNHAAYLRYFESARMSYLQRIGLALPGAHGLGVILAHLECRFLRPVHWPQRLTVRCGCTAVGQTSFTLAHEAADELGRPVAAGSCVLVMYDYAAARKVPVPHAVRQAIARVQAAGPEG